MAPEIKIRQATDSDAFALRRLATLDDRPPLTGDVLLAEKAGDVRAAISIETGQVIANPFARTRHLVAMLRSQRECLTAIAA